MADDIDEVAKTGGGPARAALDGHRREEDGEVPKFKKKAAPKKKPSMLLVLSWMMTDK